MVIDVGRRYHSKSCRASVLALHVDRLYALGRRRDPRSMILKGFESWEWYAIWESIRSDDEASFGAARLVYCDQAR